MAERGLRHMLARNGGQTRKGIALMAVLLSTFGANHCGFSEADVTKLRRLADRVAVRESGGITRKNRDRLRVLQEEKALRRLLFLPETLVRRHKDSDTPYRRALRHEDALAISILLVCPIRMKNLCEIHLERNLQRPRDGRVFLVFPETDVKNGRPLEFELQPDLVARIDGHLASRSPTLCPSATPWLFPRRDGEGPVLASQLSTRIARRIRKETGIAFNAHLFRHLAAMLLLEAHPGAYEMTRRLLGHASTSHTINVYTGLETGAATRAFSRLIAGKKAR
jgi:integrase